MKRIGFNFTAEVSLIIHSPI